MSMVIRVPGFGYDEVMAARGGHREPVPTMTVAVVFPDNFLAAYFGRPPSADQPTAVQSVAVHRPHQYTSVEVGAVGTHE